MAKYGNNYKKSSTPSGPPNTFTAKITVPSQEHPRHIPNCKVWNGVVVQLIAVGKGKKTERAYWSSEGDADVVEEWDYYAYVPSPLFCKMKFRDEYERQEAITVSGICEKKKDWTECFEKYQHAIFVMGDNGNGYVVEDEKQVRERTIQENRTVHLYDRGLIGTGYSISERLPADVFAKIRPHATYFAANEDDMEFLDDQGYYDIKPYEVRGWYYSLDVVPILTGLGYTVWSFDQIVRTAEDVSTARIQFDEQKKQEQQVANRRIERRKSLVEQFGKLVDWAYMDKADTSLVDDLPKILMPILDWKGPHLYGVGFWAKRDDAYFYKVSQNGHDGDDWSRNNSRSGITYRTPMTDELRSLLDEIKQFESES